MNPRDCAEKVREIAKSSSDNKTVAIVFGQEDRGLTNNELQRCNYHVHIPTNPEYSSLNVAMALQVVAYELRMDYLLYSGLGNIDETTSTLSSKDDGWDEEAATINDVEGLVQHLEEVMTNVDFFDPDNPRQLIPRLRRLYQRSSMDKIEVNIIRGFLTAITKAISK